MVREPKRQGENMSVTDDNGFREKLFEQGLGWTPSHLHREGRKDERYSFYSNSGDVECDSIPEAAYKLVSLAVECGCQNPNPRYLLGLHTPKEDLEGDSAHWDRYGADNPAYISLRDWLEHNGLDMSGFPPP
jgi:hypothetical protein